MSGVQTGRYLFCLALVSSSGRLLRRSDGTFVVCGWTAPAPQQNMRTIIDHPLGAWTGGMRSGYTSVSPGCSDSLVMCYQAAPSPHRHARTATAKHQRSISEAFVAFVTACLACPAQNRTVFQQHNLKQRDKETEHAQHNRSAMSVGLPVATKAIVAPMVATPAIVPRAAVTIAVVCPIPRRARSAGPRQGPE